MVRAPSTAEFQSAGPNRGIQPYNRGANGFDRGQSPDRSAQQLARPAQQFNRPEQSFGHPVQQYNRPMQSPVRPQESLVRPAQPFNRAEPFSGAYGEQRGETFNRGYGAPGNGYPRPESPGQEAYNRTAPSYARPQPYAGAQSNGRSPYAYGYANRPAQPFAEQRPGTTYGPTYGRALTRLTAHRSRLRHAPLLRPSHAATADSRLRPRIARWPRKFIGQASAEAALQKASPGEAPEASGGGGSHFGGAGGHFSAPKGGGHSSGGGGKHHR